MDTFLACHLGRHVATTSRDKYHKQGDRTEMRDRTDRTGETDRTHRIDEIDRSRTHSTNKNMID